MELVDFAGCAMTRDQWPQRHTGNVRFEISNLESLCASVAYSRCRRSKDSPRIEYLRQQQFQVLFADRADQAVVGVDDRVRKISLALLKGQHLFLDGPLGNQAEGEDL